MAKGTLNVNSVNNYMANFEWDDEELDETMEEERAADQEYAGYEVDENGLVIIKDKEKER